MKKFKRIFLYMLVIVVISFIIGYLLPRPYITALDGEIPFDDSTCQYPHRLTNPEGGCDNTDLTCNAEIKGGTCEVVQDIPEQVEVAEKQKDTVNVCQ